MGLELESFGQVFRFIHMPVTHDDLHDFFSLLDTHAREVEKETRSHELAGREPSRPIAVRFEIGEAGSWTLRLSPDGPGECVRDGSSLETAASSSSQTPDCTVSVADDVLLDLANGHKFAMVMLKGLISVTGDRTVFAKELQPLLKAAMSDFKARRQAMLAAATPIGALRVAVHGSSIVADSSHEAYAVYLLEVFEGDQRWTLARRWSQVRALERHISRARPAIKGAPSLPRMLDFAGSLERDFLNRRAGIISDYLNAALASIPTSVLMWSGASLALRLFLSPGDDSFAAPHRIRPPSFTGRARTASAQAPTAATGSSNPATPMSRSNVNGRSSSANGSSSVNGRSSSANGCSSGLSEATSSPFWRRCRVPPPLVRLPHL